MQELLCVFTAVTTNNLNFFRYNVLLIRPVKHIKSTIFAQGLSGTTLCFYNTK